MVILRGENIVALTAEAPPNQAVNCILIQDKKLEPLAGGPGKATAVNRTGQIGGSSLGVEGLGMQQAPIGVGQPSQASMMPKV